jgi:hypothetical protein
MHSNPNIFRLWKHGDDQHTLESGYRQQGPTYLTIEVIKYIQPCTLHDVTFPYRENMFTYFADIGFMSIYK